jgi:hypothetical protein
LLDFFPLDKKGSNLHVVSGIEVTFALKGRGGKEKEKTQNIK